MWVLKRVLFICGLYLRVVIAVFSDSSYSFWKHGELVKQSSCGLCKVLGFWVFFSFFFFEKSHCCQGPE